MERPALKVVVRVEPQQELTRAQLDQLMDGELSAFEKDLRARQQAKGLSGESLTGMERGVLKAYLFFAHGRTA